jgi:hypothetical protein
MTLKTDVDQFQKDIDNCLETTEYLYQFCDQIQESSEDELSYFFLQLQGLCQELERQLSEASQYLLEINRKWGDTTLSQIKFSSTQNLSGIASLVNAIDQLTPINGQTQPLKSPHLIEGDSQKLKDNLIAKGEPFRDGYQAHHIIPSSVADKSDLMLNAVEKAGFDIDCAENGIFLPDNILGDELLPSHRGNHPRYSNIAEDILKHKWDELKKYGVQDDKVALLSAINDTVKYLREVIETQGRQLRFKVNDV